MCIKNFKAGDENNYRIELEDDGTEIKVYSEEGYLGAITMELREVDDGDTYFHINSLSLDQCPSRIGIGRACLMFHQKTFDSILTAGEADGISMSDGSHLTGAGVPFIQAMRDEGIVAVSIYDDPYEG